MTDQIIATEDPIFVMCYSRSGSTLVRYILDSHPQVVCPPELHLAITCARLAKLYVDGIYSRSLTDKNERRIHAIGSVRNIVTEIMSEVCEVNGKTRWCEKSVSTIDYSGLMASLFPQAKFICLHRNAFDFEQSALEALELNPGGESFGFTPFLSAAGNDKRAGVLEYWCSKTKAIMEFETLNAGRSHRVLYEDLVSEPETTISGMHEFLGLPWEAQMLGDIFSVEHVDGPGDWKIKESNKILSSSVGRYRLSEIQHIDAQLLARIETLQSSLGYDLEAMQ